MEAILDSLYNYVLIIGDKGNIKFCNKKLLEKIDYSKYELLDNNICKLLNEDSNKIYKDINKIKKSEKINLDISILSRYEEYIPLNCDIVIENFKGEECIFLIGSDISKDQLDTLSLKKNTMDLDGKPTCINKHNSYKTDLNIINEELLKSISYETKKRLEIEKELKDFAKISVNFIAKIKTNGEILNLNNKWKNKLGWSEEELLNMNFLDIVHDDYLADMLDIMGESNERFDYCINKILCKDGNYKIIKWNYKVIPKEGIMLMTGKDITKEKEEEEERLKLEDTIKLESFKNEFFANVSHEFKTPLNIILGSVQLITRNIELDKSSNEFSKKHRKHIDIIKQNSYRLLRLVNNLIDITRIEGGFYQLQLGNYNIVSIVENITLSVAQYIENKGINLIFDTNCEEKIVACDPDKIERIILNLMSNAIKYTKENGTIYVNLNIDENKVCISIEDSGIGISKDKLDIIFERYQQVDNNLTRRSGGSGIGLSLVKSLVELHDGIIYVTSKENIGTKFTFELPIRLLENECIAHSMDNSYEAEQIEKCNIEFSDIYI